MDSLHSKVPGQATFPTLTAEFGYPSITHLNPRQEKLCWEFVLNGSNIKSAYLKAYPGSQERSAISNGCRLLKTEAVQRRITEIKRELLQRYAVDAQSVVRLLTMSMNVDRRLFVNDEGKPLEFHELEPEAAAITDIEIVFDRHGNKHARPVVVERIKAGVELAKIMGITREKIEISGDFSRYTDEQLDAEEQRLEAQIVKDNPERIRQILEQLEN